MKNKFLCIVTLILVVTFCASDTAIGKAKPCSQCISDEDSPTVEEAAEIRSFAKKFTKRLYETKDIAPLVDEFFVSDFLQHDSPLDDKSRHSTLLPQLSEDEQKRVYVAMLNCMYYVSLSVLNKEESENETSSEQAYENLFTPAIATEFAFLGERYNGLFEDADEDGHTDPQQPEQVREFLSKFEKTLVEAREHLRHLQPEQTPVLTSETIKWESDDAYSMKSYWDENLPADAKAYQVFLPILLDIAVVKVDGQWKVWAMFSDGD